MSRGHHETATGAFGAKQSRMADGSLEPRDMGADETWPSLKFPEGATQSTVTFIGGPVETVVCRHFPCGLPYWLHGVELW